MNKKLKFSLQRKGEGAVSEAIGFLLIFSLVMVGIGLITLYGYPMLLEQQSNANVRNMERDMIVLQNDMKSLVYKNVPYKETSLQVSGGALSVYNYSMTNSKFNIYLDGVLIPEFTDQKSGQLVYESDNGESIIALENGAVLTRMEFQQGSAMLAEPRWFNDAINNTNTLIITFMNVSADNVMSRNGIGVVKMRIEGEPEYYPYPTEGIDADGMLVEVEYIKDSQKYNFTKAWENYFDSSSLNMNPSAHGYGISGIHKLIIKRYDIRIISI